MLQELMQGIAHGNGDCVIARRGGLRHPARQRSTGPLGGQFRMGFIVFFTAVRQRCDGGGVHYM